MKWVVAILALSAFITTTHAAEKGTKEIEALGQLNGKALACSQTENISRIKAVMIKHSPKLRYYGAIFEKTTEESFMNRSQDQDACVDAPLIALQIEDIEKRLVSLFAARKQP